MNLRNNISDNGVTDSDTAKVVAFFYKGEILFRQTSLTPIEVLKIVGFYLKWEEEQKRQDAFENLSKHSLTGE